MSCTAFTFKQGANFILNCATSQPINGWGIVSKIRRANGDLVAELDVTVTQTTPTGIFKLTCENTADWPLETLQADILYTPSGRDVPSETFYINVIEMISR